MYRQAEKLVDEREPSVAALGCVSAGCAMSKFRKRDDRKGNFLVSDSTRYVGNHSSSVLALALGGDQHTRI